MTAARTEASEERRRRLAAEAEADAVTQLESALQREQGVVLQQAEAARDAAEAKTAALVEEHDATLAGILAASRASTQDATTAAQVYAEEVDMQAAQLAAANKAIEAKAEAQAAVHKAQLLEAEENYRGALAKVHEEALAAALSATTVAMSEESKARAQAAHEQDTLRRQVAEAAAGQARRAVAAATAQAEARAAEQVAAYATRAKQELEEEKARRVAAEKAADSAALLATKERAASHATKMVRDAAAVEECARQAEVAAARARAEEAAALQEQQNNATLRAAAEALASAEKKTQALELQHAAALETAALEAQAAAAAQAAELTAATSAIEAKALAAVAAHRGTAEVEQAVLMSRLRAAEERSAAKHAAHAEAEDAHAETLDQLAAARAENATALEQAHADAVALMEAHEEALASARGRTLASADALREEEALRQQVVEAAASHATAQAEARAAEQAAAHAATANIELEKERARRVEAEKAARAAALLATKESAAANAVAMVRDAAVAVERQRRADASAARAATLEKEQEYHVNLLTAMTALQAAEQKTATLELQHAAVLEAAALDAQTAIDASAYAHAAHMAEQAHEQAPVKSEEYEAELAKKDAAYKVALSRVRDDAVVAAMAALDAEHRRLGSEEERSVVVALEVERSARVRAEVAVNESIAALKEHELAAHAREYALISAGLAKEDEESGRAAVKAVADGASAQTELWPASGRAVERTFSEAQVDDAAIPEFLASMPWHGETHWRTKLFKTLRAKYTWIDSSGDLFVTLDGIKGARADATAAVPYASASFELDANSATGITIRHRGHGAESPFGTDVVDFATPAARTAFQAVVAEVAAAATALMAPMTKVHAAAGDDAPFALESPHRLSGTDAILSSAVLSAAALQHEGGDVAVASGETSGGSTITDALADEWRNSDEDEPHATAQAKATTKRNRLIKRRRCVVVASRLLYASSERSARLRTCDLRLSLTPLTYTLLIILLLHLGAALDECLRPLPHQRTPSRAHF